MRGSVKKRKGKIYTLKENLLGRDANGIKDRRNGKELPSVSLYDDGET